MVKYLALLYLRKYSQAGPWYTLFQSLCQAASEPTKVYAWRDFLSATCPFVLTFSGHKFTKFGDLPGDSLAARPYL